MPTLFGRHLIDKTVFLSLDEVADNLPPLVEQVIPVALDAEQQEAYDEVEEKLSAAIRDMVRRGDKRLLGAMLGTLLGFQDHPFGWGTVGYRGQEGTFVPVCDVPDLDATTIRPKEQALLDLCLAERAAGRQSWVYVNMTGKRDVAARLLAFLNGHGLRTKILRADIPLAKREEWIAKHGRDADVILSHPKLVETGLDLFSKIPGGHNFATLVFYQTGYNLFTLRQAARRAWRIGQRLPCRVVYLYYTGTMQSRAMSLMGRKMLASQAIEGKFSSEGLVAMAGEDGDVTLALAKSLAESLDELDATRVWDKYQAEPLPSPQPERSPKLAPEPTPEIIRFPDRARPATLYHQPSLFELVEAAEAEQAPPTGFR